MAKSITDNNRTFSLKHVGFIAAVFVVLLSLHWFKSGFLLANKPLESNSIDVVASNQVYKEFAELANSDGETIVLDLPKNTNQQLAQNNLPLGQVLGQADSNQVANKAEASYLVTNVAIPLLTGRFTSTQILEVADILLQSGSILE